MEVRTDSNGSSATTEAMGKRLRIAPAFTERFYDILSPGSTIVVTDDPALPTPTPSSPSLPMIEYR